MIEAKLFQLIQQVCPATYPLTAPKGVKAPFVVYSRVSTTRLRDFDGPVGTAWPTFRVDVYAKGFDDARALANEVRVKLDGYRDDTISDCACINEIDLSDLTSDPDLTRVQLEFRVCHEE